MKTADPVKFWRTGSQGQVPGDHGRRLREAGLQAAVRRQAGTANLHHLIQCTLFASSCQLPELLNALACAGFICKMTCLATLEQSSGFYETPPTCKPYFRRPRRHHGICHRVQAWLAAQKEGSVGGPTAIKVFTSQAANLAQPATA